MKNFHAVSNSVIWKIQDYQKKESKLFQWLRGDIIQLVTKVVVTYQGGYLF